MMRQNCKKEMPVVWSALWVKSKYFVVWLNLSTNQVFKVMVCCYTQLPQKEIFDHNNVRENGKIMQAYMRPIPFQQRVKGWGQVKPRHTI